MARVRPDDTSSRLATLVRQYLRSPDGYATDDTTGDPVFDFNPALTTAEQGTYTDLLGMARMGVSNSLSLAEYQALKPDLAGLRTFRTRTLAQWNALSAATREADEIAYLNDLTDVIRALLRDG